MIFTGGTIGSKVVGDKISPSADTKYALTENYLKNSLKEVSFDYSEPYFILSENLSAEHLNKLIFTVKENLNKDFSGIIVTHGTDTLTFSAAALHYALGKTEIPVVLVSANYPLDDMRSNGNDNFKSAVDFIEKGEKGVFIAYKNNGENPAFHSGDKLISFNESDDRLYSIYNKPFAEYENGEISLLGSPLLFPEKTDFKFCENPNILCISAMPGDNFKYNLDSVNAVILRPYHSGTFNTENENFKVFCKRAHDLGVPLFLVCAPSGVTYETVGAYNQLGIIALSGVPFSAAYVRIWAAISQNTNLKNLF